MDAQVAVGAEDVQVAAKPRRRTYTAEYKRRILKEADACTTAGAVGALLRREGLYSSHPGVWRRGRGGGGLGPPAPQKGGRGPTPPDGRPREIGPLQAESAPVTRSAATGRRPCSIRTMYRVLAANAEVRERRNQLRHPAYHKPELLATAPNQVWSWDITKLLGPVTWTYYYLYVLLDIFSRYVVGWLLARQESAALAKVLTL